MGCGTAVAVPCLVWASLLKTLYRTQVGNTFSLKACPGKNKVLARAAPRRCSASAPASSADPSSAPAFEGPGCVCQQPGAAAVKPTPEQLCGLGGRSCRCPHPGDSPHGKRTPMGRKRSWLSREGMFWRGFSWQEPSWPSLPAQQGHIHPPRGTPRTAQPISCAASQPCLTPASWQRAGSSLQAHGCAVQTPQSSFYRSPN